MKAQHRYTILSAFVLLLLTLAIASWQRWAEVSVGRTERRHIAQDPLRKSATTDAQAATNGQSMVTTSEKDSPHSARGSGYVWGKALNEVYAANTVNSEGVRHLDLTKLAKSFRKFERPVNLEDASALTQARAEYLASVITAALDLKTSYQAQLADILQDYYTSDWRNREIGQNEKANERGRLSDAARNELVAFLPSEAREKFLEIFASRVFLFRSMSLSANEITLEVGGGTVNTTGSVAFTVDPGGAIQFESAGMSFQSTKPLMSKTWCRVADSVRYTPVPEPTTLFLLCAGATVCCSRRR